MKNLFYLLIICLLLSSCGRSSRMGDSMKYWKAQKEIAKKENHELKNN
ncbi:MAG: hypothetical protein ABIP51_23770 [Bacteroidia bacterium]